MDNPSYGTGASDGTGAGPDPAGPFVRQAAGTSLMELLVVLAVIAVLAALALPDMGVFTARKRLMAQTDRILLDLRRTRDLAMEQACPWRMVFDPAGDTWHCYGDADEDGKPDDGEKTLGPFSLGRGVSFGSRAGVGPNGTALPTDGVSFQDDQVCFSPMGCCNSGTIYLTDRDSSTAIRVLPASGAVKVWQHRGAWRALP
jgi:type II secretory pathway pseudopilin PulG